MADDQELPEGVLRGDVDDAIGVYIHLMSEEGCRAAQAPVEVRRKVADKTIKVIADRNVDSYSSC